MSYAPDVDNWTPFLLEFLPKKPGSEPGGADDAPMPTATSKFTLNFMLPLLYVIFFIAPSFSLSLTVAFTYNGKSTSPFALHHSHTSSSEACALAVLPDRTYTSTTSISSPGPSGKRLILDTMEEEGPLLSIVFDIDIDSLKLLNFLFPSSFEGFCVAGVPPFACKFSNMKSATESALPGPPVVCIFTLRPRRSFVFMDIRGSQPLEYFFKPRSVISTPKTSIFKAAHFAPPAPPSILTSLPAFDATFAPPLLSLCSPKSLILSFDVDAC
mmetsp:Transcript_8602/g.28223  ORF Transcript_8602/g.28223 Transcript_8602/m.28223 type:complete len:270 (+) Transcript_8602:2925-3734(+)